MFIAKLYRIKILTQVSKKINIFLQAKVPTNVLALMLT